MDLVWTTTLNLALLTNQPGWVAIGAIAALAVGGVNIEIVWPLVVILAAVTAPMLCRAMKPSPSRPPQIAAYKRTAVFILSLIAFAVSVLWPWPLRFVVACVAQALLVLWSYALAGSRAGLHLWWLVLTLIMLGVVGAVDEHTFALVMGIGWMELTALVFVSMLEVQTTAPPPVDEDALL